ncbi:hypothetical protein HCZ23_13310 [Celeribacter sp. HF31]|uniref:hypothetical protein n=1 Tax=Celeribacter sp. HF31 TaxID=2721558 RepID=UPI001430250E|nr:hypothetical protein [Celeribacter sp. HF31]NIY80438.1 hypothetical protein [Celeribacter sp. HF31]
MTKFQTYLACGALSVLPLAAASESLMFSYTQPMEGVYEQHWAGHEIASMETYAGQPYRIYVEGQGKLGEFHGILSLDCETPRYSSWLAQSEYLSAEDVPTEVINGLRATWCVK